MDGHYQIRDASARDVAPVVAIEGRVFTLPWSADAFRDYVQKAVFLVAESNGAVIGYLIARGLGEAGEILNVAVVGEWRRRGVATALLHEALRRLEDEGAGQVYLEVRASSSGAQQLYREHGFREVGRRRRYYTNPTEDAIVFMRRANATPGGAEKGSESRIFG